MSRKPVGGTAEAVAVNNTSSQEFDISKVNFATIASSATRDANGRLIPAVTKTTLDTEYGIPKLLKILNAAMAKAQETGENVKVSLTNYDVDASRESDAFNKYFNGKLKVNIGYLDEQGVISKEDYFAK